jgi:hypothetical protein
MPVWIVVLGECGSGCASLAWRNAFIRVNYLDFSHRIAQLTLIDLISQDLWRHLGNPTRTETPLSFWSAQSSFMYPVMHTRMVVDGPNPSVVVSM